LFKASTSTAVISENQGQAGAGVCVQISEDQSQDNLTAAAAQMKTARRDNAEVSGGAF
jgi:hypothetical protein